MSSRHIPGAICSALPEERPGRTVASKAITDPGTGHHGPFGRIDVLKKSERAVVPVTGLAFPIGPMRRLRGWCGWAMSEGEVR